MGRHAVGEVARPSRGRTSSFRARTRPLPRVSTPKFRAGSGARIWIRSKFRSGLPSFITFHFLFTFLAVLAIDEQLFSSVLCRTVPAQGVASLRRTFWLNSLLKQLLSFV